MQFYFAAIHAVRAQIRCNSSASWLICSHGHLSPISEYSSTSNKSPGKVNLLVGGKGAPCLLGCAYDQAMTINVSVQCKENKSKHRYIKLG